MSAKNDPTFSDILFPVSFVSEAREKARESRDDPTFAVLEQALRVLVDASRAQQAPADAPQRCLAAVATATPWQS